MNYDNQLNSGSAYAGTSATTYDAGLRGYMVRMFNAVAAGLAASGLAAFAVYNVPALLALVANPMVNMVMMIGLFIFLWVGMNPNKVMQQSAASLQVKYYGFAIVFGALLAPLLLAYTHTSVTRVFFITAATFAATSLFGYTTKRDLSNWGSFLIMGAIGIMLAMLVNIFLKSSGLDFAISVIGVLVYTGFMAFHTQTAKRMYSQANGDEMNNKLATYNALSLYLDFVNLFLFMLRLFGSRN